MRKALVITAVVSISAVVAPPAGAAERCFGRRATIVGTDERDRINGTSQDDVIVTGNGHDRVNGRGGDDLICTGKGHDQIRGRSGNDRADGGPGSDYLVGHAGDDELIGGSGGDGLFAGDGNDLMRAGGSAYDFLLGGPGDDLYDGGAGATDVASLEGAPVGVTVDLAVGTPQTSGEGQDTFLGVEGLFGSAFNDVIRGHDVPAEIGNGLFGLDGSDELLGLDGNDVISGGAGNDNTGIGLDGGAGNDQIFGDDYGEFFGTSGDDDLYGGQGDDLLDGGGNATGPPMGDFGNGGPHVNGDQCFNVEDAATTECEHFGRRLVRTTGSLEWASSLHDAWTAVISRWS